MHVMVDLPSICIKLDVVPPLASWKARSKDIAELSHINLQVGFCASYEDLLVDEQQIVNILTLTWNSLHQVVTLAVPDVSHLSGVLGVSASSQYPSAETSEDLFDAARVVSEDVLSIVPW